MTHLSRRDFMALAGATLAATQLRAQAEKGTLTAGEVVDRIKKAIVENIGQPWNNKSFRDTFKVGNPDMPVHGIATSFGGNYRVWNLANQAGLNFVIVHEPTYYSDADMIDWVKDDPMYLWKLDWATKHNIVEWRIHDHWHRHKPDGIQTGWNNAIGWNQYLEPGQLTHWKLPQTTLGELAKYVAKTLKTRSVRVIGDPNLPVSTVWRGGHLLVQNVQALQNADAILVSETREYDSFEYVRDAVLSGQKKGAIFISHCSGEDEGMNYFAEWLRPMVPEVPIKFISTTDEFWTV
jgi:putative NIF3 family GTP cyclohydrolase 1 type 2